MGTRSLTRVIETYKDESGKKKTAKLLTMYAQYDGYPSGLGKNLADFLTKGKLVNGIGLSDTLVFNGMGCLSAQLITNFKTGPGGFYIEPVNAKNCGEAYEYHIIGEQGSNEITLKCFEVGYINASNKCINKRRLLFEGNPIDFDNFLDKTNTD